MSDEKSTAGDTSVLTPTLRERLKDGAPVVPVTVKPAAKSKAIPAWMARQYKGMSGGEPDRVIPVAAPTHDAPAWLAAEMPPPVMQRPAASRRFASEPGEPPPAPGFLNQISPRSRD